jgi:hypothetical protein
MNLNMVELSVLQGLMNYLTNNMDPGSISMAVDCTVIDANGDTIGTVEYDGDQGEYAFFPYVAAPPTPITVYSQQPGIPISLPPQTRDGRDISGPGVPE